MGFLTIGAVTDRVNSLVATQGFARSTDHFDFVHQPDQNIDRIYRVESERVGSNGYIGGDQEEVHRVSVWLTRKVRSDSHGASRQLKADMDLVEQALIDDSILADYNVQDEPGPDGSVQLPDPDATHVIARLSAVVDFDRDL